MEKSRTIGLQLAGMTREGALGRIVEPGLPFVAYEAVRPESDEEGRPVLFFSGETREAHGPWKSVFDDFLDLHEAPVEDLAAFAEYYGPLWICKHGHGLFGCPEGCGAEERFTYSEPVSLWRALVTDVVTILDLAAQVHRGEEPVLVDENARVRGGAPIIGEPPYDALEADEDGQVRLDQPDAIQFVRLGVNWWIRAGAVRVSFEWGQNGPSIQIPAWGLRGAVAKHLLFTVCKIDGLAFCDNCARPFVPSRKPRADQHTWCDRDDCQKARYRVSKRKQRKRNSQEES